MDKNSAILITGANGVLGVAIHRKLMEYGYKNIFSPSRRELDCLDPGSINEWFSIYKPSHVFHLASLVFGLKGNIDNQLRGLHENTLIAQNVFAACANHGVRKIFYAGTVAAYPYPYPSLPLKEESFLMGEPHAGEYGYAIAKRHALAYLKILHRENATDFCYGIFTNLYGKHDKFDIVNGHVIPSLISKGYSALSSGEPILKVWGRPDTVRDFLYSEDAAEAAILAMQKYVGEINISSGIPTRMDDVADAINEAFEGALRIEWQADAPVGIPYRVVDATRLSALGFSPLHTLRAGISETVKWYKINQGTVRR